MSRRLLALVCVLGLVAGVAHAQRAADPRMRLPMPADLAPPRPGPDSRLIDLLPLEGAARTQTPVPALPPAAMQRLQSATGLRQLGLGDRARDSLAVLDRAWPHHPTIVTERVRAELQRRDFASAEKLARAERGRDSLLVARELAVALDGLGRSREALEVAMTALAASPAEADWASLVLMVAGARDWRVARDVLKPIFDKRPRSVQVAYAYSIPLIKLGQSAEAMRVITPLDRPVRQSPRRLRLSDELLQMATAADTAAAFEALWSVSGDRALDESYRRYGARRAWELSVARGAAGTAAPRFVREMSDVPASRRGADLAVGVARALREAGHAAEARALLAGLGDGGTPESRLERAYADLRDGLSSAAIARLDTLAQTWPEARFALAEAQFWAGDMDSALANYARASENPQSDHAGVALDRTYLLEDFGHQPALRVLGRIEYEGWRGDAARARAMNDSLYASMKPSDPLWDEVAMRAGEQRLAANDARGALVPLMALAETHPAERLAPRARQRAGDAWLALGDPARALEQYEECLARYPRAWNAAEVRRRVEALRKERRP